MRLTSSTRQMKNRFRIYIIIAGLFAGATLTALIWLKVPSQIITFLSWASLGLIVLGGYFFVRRLSSSRWITILTVLAAVSLVYLFPELFRPVCGGMPRAFASPSARCDVCIQFVCEWNPKKHQEHCYCDEWDTSACVQNQPPNITPELVCSLWGENNWCTGSFTLNLTAVEPQDQDVMISGDVNGTVFACPASHPTSACPVPLPEGNGFANYLATSISGLTASGSTSFQHDSLQPLVDGRLNGILGDNNWYISPVEVSASASDLEPGSGLTAFEYKLNRADWENYAEPFVLSDGVYNLNLRASDGAGNVIETNQSIQIDTTTPVLDLSADGTIGENGWYNSKVQVSALASDSGSGLSLIEYELDGTGWAAYTNPLELTDGVHTLNLRATDNAGNLTEGSQTFQVDASLPEINLSANGSAGNSNWYISAVQVGAEASDSVSGLAALEMSIDNGDWEAYSIPVEFGDGFHTYQFRAIDHAGNLTYTELKTIQIDTVSPVIDMLDSWDLGHASIFKLQDNGSGLAVVRLVIEDEDERYPKVSWEDNLDSYKFKGEIDWNGRFKGGQVASPGGEYYAWLKVRDHAGNESLQAGQIIVPVSNFVEELILPSDNMSDNLVSGTESSESVVESPTPLSTLPNNMPFVQPPVENAAPPISFGGSNNGAAQPSGAQAGKVSFNAGGSSNSPTASNPSNVLWGATATATMGAFAAEIARRKAQKAAREAAIARALDNQEERGSSNYRQKVKAKKAAKLEIKWEQERLAEQLRATAANEHVLEQKEGQLEQEMHSNLTKEQAQKDAAARAQQKVYDIFRAQEVAAQTIVQPVMCTPENIQKEKSWWEKSIDWVDKHQTEISLAVGIAIGLTAIILSGGTAAPLVAAAWIAGSALVAGGTIAVGTMGLNSYYGRDLDANVLRNFGLAAGATIATAGAAFLLNAVAPVATRTVASFCMGHVTTCTVAGPAFKAIDYAWTGYDTWQAERILDNPHSRAEDRLTAGLTIALAAWSEALEPDELLPISLPLDDIARREITEKFAKIVEEKGSKAGLEYLEGILGKNAPITKVFNAVDDADTAIKLFTTLDKDVLEYAVKQGPDAVKALAKWDNVLLEEYGIELALRSSQDAKALKATQELISLGPLDPKNITREQEELLKIIADNSVQQINKGQVVVGKWTTFDTGFSGYAIDSSSIHYSQHPDLWPMLEAFGDNQGEVAWLINQRAIQSKIGEGLPFEYTLKGIEPGKVDREMDAIEAVWNNASDLEIIDTLALADKKVPYRIQELRELYDAGYIFTFDEVYNSYIFIKP